MSLWRYIAYGVAALTPIVAWRLASARPSNALDTAAGKGKAPPWWTPADYRAHYASAGRIRMNAADLLLVEASESGLDPRASYPGELAVGLNQLTAASNALTGLSEAERRAIPTMPVAAQIPIVERYFRNLQWTKAGKGYPTVGVAYAQNFLPGRAMARGAAPDTVLGTLEEFPLNAGLADAAGNFTVRSLETHLKKVAAQGRYLGALQALRDATGDRNLSPRFAT